MLERRSDQNAIDLTDSKPHNAPEFKIKLSYCITYMVENSSTLSLAELPGDVLRYIGSYLSSSYKSHLALRSKRLYSIFKSDIRPTSRAMRQLLENMESDVNKAIVPIKSDPGLLLDKRIIAIPSHKFIISSWSHTWNDSMMKKILDILPATSEGEAIRIALLQQRYKRAQDNPDAAELFLSYKIPEDTFNNYLTLVPQDDVNHIPDVFIPGEAISAEYKDYYLTKLSPCDPRAALLGEFTQCSQNLGDKKYNNAVIHAITHPESGFYVLCKMPTGKPSRKDIILSQCWAWRGVNKEMVFDSVKSEYDLGRYFSLMIEDFYTYLAHHLVLRYGIPRVLVGISITTESMAGIMVCFSSAVIRDYTGSHCFRQKLVADIELPLLPAYLRMHPESAVKLDQFPGLSPKSEAAVYEWFDLCMVNNMEFLLDCLEPYLAALRISKDDISQRKLQWRVVNHFAGQCESKDFIIYFTMFVAIKAGELDILRILLERKTNPNQVSFGNYQASPLHIAAENGQLEAARLLLQHGANVHRKDSYGRTPLHWAAEARHQELIALLLANGAVVTASDESKNTPLHCIFPNRLSVKVMDTLPDNALTLALAQQLHQAGADIHQLSSCGHSPLSLAVKSAQIDAAKFLVSEGADVNILDCCGYTLLHIAVQTDSLEMVRWLTKEQHLSVHAKTCIQRSVLHHIPEQPSPNKKHIIAYLLELGADINAKDKFGDSPLDQAYEAYRFDTLKIFLELDAGIVPKNQLLSQAIYRSQFSLAKTLIERGADINQVNGDGKSLLAVVIDSVSDKEGITAEIEFVDLVNYMLSQGAVLTEYDKKSALISRYIQRNLTSSHISGAAWHVLRILIELGIKDLEQRFVLHGYTLMHIAATSNRCDIIKALAQRGADVNARNCYDETPLYMAVSNWNSFDVVTCLVECKADITLKCHNDRSLLRHALYRNADGRNAPFLIAQGADIHEKDCNGDSLLKEAAIYGDWQNGHVQLLVEKGLDVNEQDHVDGYCVLHWAAIKNQWAALQWLLEHGADATLRSRNRQTALDIVASNATPETIKLLQSAMQRKTIAAPVSSAALFQPAKPDRNSGISKDNDEAARLPSESGKINTVHILS